jgi:ribonuclease D
LPADYQWITADEQLASLMARCADESVVGIDTEFIRTRTFYPIAALYQVAVGGEIGLIDPLEIEDWTPLRELLTDPQRRLLMHSCSEDMEVFAWHLKATPNAVFDTQVAAAFLGPKYSVSYSSLVSEWLNIDVAKDQTRSDWLQRPLTSAQLDYAAADVRYLQPMYEAMRSALESRGRWQWFL